MEREIPLVALRDVTVLFPGDFHELAVFVSKVHRVCDREANAHNPHTVQKSRLTLHGLAGCYARVTDINQERVEQILVKAGLDLGALVEFDRADSEVTSDQHSLK
jgi:hypothetical protein